MNSVINASLSNAMFTNVMLLCMMNLGKKDLKQIPFSTGLVGIMVGTVDGPCLLLHGFSLLL